MPKDTLIITGFKSKAPLLKFKEVQQLLDVKSSTLYQWVKARKIASIKLEKELRFYIEDIEDFIEPRRRKTHAQLAQEVELKRKELEGWVPFKSELLDAKRKAGRA